MSACEMCGKSLVDCTSAASLRLCGSCTTIYIAQKEKKIRTYKQISELIEENTTLRAELSRLKAEREWLKIEDCPDNTEVWIIARKYSGYEYAQAEKIDGKFYSIWGSSQEFENVIGWRHLPQPPEDAE